MSKSNDARSKIKMNGERDFRAKQEGDNNNSNIPKTYGSRQWGGFKNPRIVCVSRAFGGKDRHSKVCTVRGLRDRRIRLSVPTAIQLYDLQDRLGVSQPSKVVDWLIDNTKDDIDKLPPLQMPQGGFSQFHRATTTLVPPDLNSNQASLFPPFFDPNAMYMKDCAKQVGIKINDNGSDGNDQKMKGKEIENENENEAAGLNFFPLANPSFLPSFSYNPLYNWEPSSSTLSQFGYQGFSSQSDSSQYGSTHPLSLMPSSLAIPTPSQFLFCPPNVTTPSLFPQLPPYMAGLGEAHDPRQFSHFQLLNSGSQHVLLNPFGPSLHINDSQDKSIQPNLNFKENSQNTDDHRQLNKGKSWLR